MGQSRSRTRKAVMHNFLCSIDVFRINGDMKRLFSRKKSLERCLTGRLVEYEHAVLTADDRLVKIYHNTRTIDCGGDRQM